MNGSNFNFIKRQIHWNLQPFNERVNDLRLHPCRCHFSFLQIVCIWVHYIYPAYIYSLGLLQYFKIAVAKKVRHFSCFSSYISLWKANKFECNCCKLYPLWFVSIIFFLVFLFTTKPMRCFYLFSLFFFLQSLILLLFVCSAATVCLNMCDFYFEFHFVVSSFSSS